MKQTKVLTRRQFLIGAAGSTIVVGSGLAYLATRQPEIEFAAESCTAAGDGGKVLVAYASQYGSTSEVAAAIGDLFCERGAAVDVASIADINDLAPYQAVIIGSPIHSEVWTPEAVAFVETHQAVLSQIPVAYFLTCMTLGLAPDTPEIRDRVAGYLDPVRSQIPAVQPVDIGLFAGALDYSKMSYAMQLLYRGFAEDDTDGDYRDWDAIRAWAAEVQPKLLGV
ncbi:MAG: flavodoxin domain-containing protein [Ardenticatenaceae bacterium]|nr:flavodoxin domain-containing protein [Ardenticatenaceae bacterium]